MTGSQIISLLSNIDPTILETGTKGLATVIGKSEFTIIVFLTYFESLSDRVKPELS